MKLSDIAAKLGCPVEGDDAVEIRGVGSLDDAIDRLTVLDPRSYVPSSPVRAAYDDAYATYRRVFDALEPLELGRGGGR